MTKKQKKILTDAVEMLRDNSASKAEKETMSNNLEQLRDELPGWLVVVLKTIAYLIGLVLAGAATSCAAQSLFNL